MSGRERADPERLRQLMMAALDGETSTQERRELDELLASDEAAKREWQRLGQVKEVTQTMVLREPPEEVWGRFWTSVYNRTERGVGWILVSVGTIILLGYAAWAFVTELLANTEMPLALKLAVFAVVVGLIVIIVSVAREKFFTWRRDSYKEIER